MAQLQSTSITGSLIVTQGITGSFSGSATNAISASYAATASYALNAGDSIWTGSAGNIYYSGGNVGIGTTVPSAKLEVYGVNGSIAILGSGYTLNPVPMLIGQYTSTKGYIQVPNQGTFEIWNGGTGAIAEFKNNYQSIFNGDVGIGTTNPISGQGTPLTLASSTGYVGLTLSGSGAYSHLWQLYASGDGGSNKFFGIYDSTNATYRLVTTSGGNVGIGTTSPARKLDVNGTSVFRDFTSVFAGSGNIVSNITWLSTDSGIMNIYTGGSPTVQLNSNGVSYFNGGNVGIGITNPVFSNGSGLVIYDASTSRLKLSNSSVGQGATDGFELIMASTDAYVWNYEAGPMLFGTNSSERMRILSGGNIGISTVGSCFN